MPLPALVYYYHLPNNDCQHCQDQQKCHEKLLLKAELKISNQLIGFLMEENRRLKMELNRLWNYLKPADQ